MNENVKSGDSIEGKNVRAVVFAVAICALMLFSSFGVMASALGAEAENALIADGSAPTGNSLAPLSALDSEMNANPESDNGQTNDVPSIESPVSNSPAQNNINASELKEMLDMLEASGQSTKGPLPTPTTTITIQDTKSWGAGKDAPIIMVDPTMTCGYYPLITGTLPGPPFEARSLVEFDLSPYVGMGFEDLITSAEFGMYWLGGPTTPVNPTAYAVTSPWLEGTGSWQPNDPFVNGVTWSDMWFGMPWFTPGGDYLPPTSSAMAVITPPWYTADVRNIVASWLDTSMPNFGLIVTDPACPGPAFFESSELWMTGNPVFAPKLTMTFLAVESHAGPLPSQIDTATSNNEFNVPYSATTIESNGLDYVNLYFRYSPDNGTTIPWTDWELYTVITGGGSYHIDGDVAFNASAGKGEYQFYTEAVTVDGSIEQDPLTRDAETFFHLNGPFPPTNIRAFNNGITPHVAVYWDLSISDPVGLWYFVAWADNPKWVDFGSMNVTIGLSNVTTSVLFLNAANDLIPDYYCVRVYDWPNDQWSNNTDTVVNRDVYYLNPRPPYSGINFDFRNMTVASNTLTVSNSNLGFDWIKVLAPGNLIVNSCDLIIDGDLTILGDVILNNVNLIMNGSYDGESRIYVAPSGTLTINGGTISNGVADVNYLFEVAGSLTMTNSNLTRCGSMNQTFLSEAGLYVSGSATLNNVWIHDCLVGVIANETATSVQVTDCTIEYCGAGTMAYGSDVLQLTDNVIAYCGGASIQDGTTPSDIFYDDMESGTGAWSWNSQSPLFYIFDGEGGEGGWTHGTSSGPDLWHLSTDNYYEYSPTHAWRDADDVTDDYDFGTIRNWLESPDIDITGTTDPIFSYWEQGYVETGFDHSYVYFSDDGGSSWVPVASYDLWTDWRQITFDITDYVTITTQFRVAFVFDTGDPIANGYPGWFIDFITIFELAGDNWEQTTSASNSPTTSWTDSDGGDYANMMDLWLMNSIDLSDPIMQFATLEFSAMFSLEGGDIFRVEVSEDGIIWTALDTKTKNSPGNGTGTFATYSYSLDRYLGNPNLLYRFRLITNSSLVDDGIYIDDVRIIGEYPRTYIDGVAVGAYSNYAGTADSTVALTNNIIVESTNYALYTDANSYMDWFVDDVAVCANSGPAANVDINGNIKVSGAGAELYLDNTVGTVGTVDIGADTTAWVDWSFLETGNVTVSGTLWVNDTVWLIDCAYPLQNHIQVIGNMYAQYDLITSGTPVPFAFWVESTGAFSFDQGTLGNCGDVSGTRAEDFGLCLDTDNASVTYSAISNCFAGVIANGSAPLIEGNSITSCMVGVACVENATPTIQLNSISGNMVGIISQGGSSPLILWNTIDANLQFGIGMQSFGMDINATIIGNEIDGNGNGGIWIEITGNLTGSISLNEVNSNIGTGIMIVDSLGMPYWVDLDISDNTVNSNTGHGILIANAMTVDLTFNDNIVNANGGYGLILTVIDDINLAADGDQTNGNSAGSGIMLQSTGGNITANIESSYMSSNGMDGLRVTTGGDVVLAVNNSDIESNGWNGIVVIASGATYLTAVSNYICDNNFIGLDIESGTIVSPYIELNDIEDSGDEGICLKADYGISDAYIVDNDLQNSGDNGIYMSVEIAGNITGIIEGNDAYSSDDDGIGVQTVIGDIDVSILGNYADECDNGGISVLAANGNVTADIIGNSATYASGIGIYVSASNNATLAIQMNDVEEGMLGILVNSLNTLVANVSGNNAYDSMIGIVIGDPIFVSLAPPMYAIVTANNNTIAECMIGLISFAIDNMSATVESNDVEDCGDGIAIVSMNLLQLDSWNNTVVNNIGGPIEAGYYVSASGDMTVTSINDTVAANDDDGMYLESGGNLIATFCGGIFSDNGDTGLYIQEDAFGTVNASISDTQANDNWYGIAILSQNNMATVDLSNITADDNTVSGILISAATDIMLTGDEVEVDNNYDGLTVLALGVATVSLNNTWADYNDNNGVYLGAMTIFATVENSSASYNNLYGIRSSASDYVQVDMAYVTAYDNSGTNILIEGTTVDGNLTDVTASESDNEDGLKIIALGDVTLNITDSTFSWNWVNGIEITASTITLNANNVYADYNDWYGWFGVGSGIYLNAMTVDADLSSIETWYNSADGIRVLAWDAYLDVNDLSSFYNGHNGLYILAQGSADLYLATSELYYNGWDGAHAEVIDGPLSVELNSCTLYDNSDNGLEAMTSGYWLVDISVHSSSNLNSNGVHGISASSSYWVDLSIGDGTWIAWNGWDTYSEAGVYINAGGASIDISGNSYIWNNYGNGVEAIGGTATDINGVNIGISLNQSYVYYNWEDGISVDTLGLVSLDAFANSNIYSNGECGIDIDTDNSIFVSMDSATSTYNYWDGINLSTPGSVWLDMSLSDADNNGQNGAHIDSYDAYVTAYDTYFNGNGQDGLDIDASNYVDVDITAVSGTSFYSNGINGLHADGTLVEVSTSGDVTANNNGECGLNLSASSYVDMDLNNFAAMYNGVDGISAVSSDIYFNGVYGSAMYNGANGMDLNASNYVYFNPQFYSFSYNGADGASIYGGNYVDVDVWPNPNYFSYNADDGLDVDTGNDCEVSVSPASSFENNGGCGANITAPDYILLNVAGLPWSGISFSLNGEHGLYANADSMDATIACTGAYWNLGRGLWLSTTDDLSPSLSNIYAQYNGDDGALLQSIDGWVYQTLSDCTFSENGGNGLAILALNGGIEAYVDNCYLDSNGENGLYLLADEVDLYPGLSVANSYSGNGGDGIHIEAFTYAYMEANLLDSSYNLGNGITMIAPDGQIWLVQVSCDDNYNGIYIDGAIQGEIDSSSTDNNARAGISVNGGYNLWIHDSYASYNSVVGMETYDCNNIYIENNYLEYNGVGIYINNTTDSTIVNNDIHYNFLDGIDVVNGSDVTLINNMITFNFGWGIFSEPGVNIEWFADSSYDGEYAYAKMNDILLWGNITVVDVSLMTLEDLTVTMGTNQNLQRHIDIFSDGLMNINDATIQALAGYWYYFNVWSWGMLDTDFATIQGAWEIRAYPNSYLNILRSNILDAGLYGIRAESGSNVNVLDSYFSGCGFSGMYIESNSVMVSGTTFETNYRGIWLVDVGPINIEDCSFIDNDRDGILVDDSFVTIPFCSFEGNGRGVRVDNDGVGLIENCWFGSNAVGVDLLNDGFADVRLSTFDGNDVGFYLDTFGYAWVENCTMDSLVQEFSQRGDSIAQTLNTVFSGPTYIIDNSQLIVMWYLDVEVLNEIYEPIAGATVDVWDALGNWIGGGSTDADGMVSWIICVNYIKSNGVVDDSMNPHYIYVDDTLAFDERYVTIDSTMTQTFILNHQPVYVPGSMSNVFFDQGMWINDVFNLNDCFTDKGDMSFSYSGNTMVDVWIDWSGWVTFSSMDPDWSGSEWITFRATDEDGLYVENTILVTVLRINTAPMITSTPVVSGTQGVQYYYLVTATDPDIPYGDYLTYSLSIAPAGMSIGPVTGLISWIPAWNQIGVAWVMVVVDDDSGGSDSQLFAISVANINDAPTITSTPSTVATENSPYTGTVTATDLDTLYGEVLTFSLTTSPAGMIIDPVTGTIYWTPASNQVGNNLVVVKVTDLGGLYDVAAFTINVANVNQAPTITSTPVTSATQDVLYYYQVTAADLDLPYGDVLTYWLASGPTGMSVNAVSGLVSWTPAWNQVGLNWVIVGVQDASTTSATQQFAIMVANVNDAPTITATPGTSATEDVQYIGTVTATDLDLSYGDVLIFSLTTSPTGMTIDAATGTIYWTPAYNQIGNNPVVVRVTDAGGLYDTAAFAIAVLNVNDAPTITSTPITSATQGVAYIYQVTAADLDLPYGDILTFSLSASPAGMAINAATGQISWTPAWNQVGLNWVTVTVTDYAMASADQVFAITVANVNDAPTITSTAIITATAGTLYTYDVNATDQDLAYGDVLTYSLTTATSGMSIDASTGLIQWMPNWHSPSPVTIVVRVSDIGGLSVTQLFQITVSGLNHAPSITGVALSPSEAFADTTISASAVGWADAETDAAQYTYQWYINGAAIGGANGPSVNGLFTKGDIVACEMTPYDGKEYGTPVTSVGLVISNSAPTLEGASILPLSPIMSDELSVTPSGFADNDTQDTTAYYMYQWQYYNTTQGQWLDIPGANSATLDTGTLKIGDKVRCIVTPFDGTDSGSPVTSNEVIMHETPGTFPAAEIATISGLIFATLFLVVLVLYIVGKIGKKAGKKGKEEPAPPEDSK
jgi:parallel beta-helix repeat protein